MPFSKEEEHLRVIQGWQRILVTRQERKENPNLPHMWNDEWERHHQDILREQYEEALAEGLNTGIYKIRCAGCFKAFYTTVSSKKYCNYNTCGMKVFKFKKRMERKMNRSDTVCEECGKLFTPKRAGAHYCSNACRQKAYRFRCAK